MGAQGPAPGSGGQNGARESPRARAGVSKTLLGRESEVIQIEHGMGALVAEWQL